MRTEERKPVGDDVLSPVTDEQRQALLDDVRELYEECAASERRFEWCEDEDGIPFDRPCLVERDGTPTPEEWLIEETGEDHFLWGWTTHSHRVFEMAKEVVWEAYRQRFGDDWRDNGELDDAACTAETKLSEWVEEKLRSEPTVNPNGRSSGSDDAHCEENGPVASARAGDRPEQADGQESLQEAKARWDKSIGMTSRSIGNERFVFCSPTGFPLADMELWPNGTGRFEASFGHPIAMQKDWLKEMRR